MNVDPASFRDPSGFVFERDGAVHRHVAASYREHYETLVGSGLYDALVKEGLLVAHEEVDGEDTGAWKVLRPEQVPRISYPYEWCFSALKDAALLTLKVQRLALAHGMTLKDASAYNVQFIGTRPVFIDTLSFEKRKPGAPWVAYRQFCEHFLAPLAVWAYTDPRANQLLRANVGGIPLDLAARLLPRRARLRPGLFLHLFLHARAQSSGGSRPAGPRGEVSEAGAQGLLDSLERAVRSLAWKLPKTVWGDYYDETNYADEAEAEKAAFIREVVAKVAPKTAIDLGANDARYSRIAAEGGAVTWAVDIDPVAVEKAWSRTSRGVSMTPLVGDLTNPSPGAGWGSRERRPIHERGRSDLVLALALIHHLAIANNVPLPKIADELARFGDDLIVEFVPREDSQVQRMLATREDVFEDYTPDGFCAAFDRVYDVAAVRQIPGSRRTLYWMRRKPREIAVAKD